MPPFATAGRSAGTLDRPGMPEPHCAKCAAMSFFSCSFRSRSRRRRSAGSGWSGSARPTIPGWVCACSPLLNHTSLFEPVFLAAVPSRVLWQLATHGVIPLADKTAARPILGRLFLLFAKRVVPVTREKDDTWEEVLRQVRDPEAVLLILPEGRMMRRTGLDVQGNPMTIRGGIADILRAMPDGRLFIAYSGGASSHPGPRGTLPATLPERLAGRRGRGYRGIPRRIGRLGVPGDLQGGRDRGPDAPARRVLLPHRMKPDGRPVS